MISMISRCSATCPNLERHVADMWLTLYAYVFPMLNFVTSVFKTLLPYQPTTHHSSPLPMVGEPDSDDYDELVEATAGLSLVPRVPCNPPYFFDPGYASNPVLHGGKFYVVTVGMKPGVYTTW